MKKILAFSIFLLVFANIDELFAQESILEKGGDQLKLFNAQQKFFAGDYRSALNLYKEVEDNQPKNALVKYRIGEIYFVQQNYIDAALILEKAKEIDVKADENLHLLLGKTYHIQGEFEKALNALNTHKATIEAGKIEKLKEVDYYINQVNTAQELMQKPVDVLITNMGDNINSIHRDKSPLVSKDGKTLVFTSRRSGGKGSEKDIKGDGLYFENVFSCVWEDSSNTWSAPEPIEGSINTEFHDAASAFYYEGDKEYLCTYMSDTESKLSRAGDVFISRRGSSGKWGKSKSFGKIINSSYYDDGAVMTSDGTKVYFFSERKGGLGGTDIYVSKKVGRREWSEPENLGPVINTDEDEGAIFLSEDGNTMFFSSKGHNSMGSYDIFKSEFKNGAWTQPQNLGYPINSVREDLNFFIVEDGKEALFVSDRDGGHGDRDIYKIDLKGMKLITTTKEESPSE